ncbi:MAG: S9 family peptidase [Candidatus Thorarchaeota archaeon]
MLIPPVAKKKPHEFEIHGVKFSDDFFWLRNKGTEEVIEYLNLENKYTKSMMEHTDKLQEQLFQEMKGRIKETDESVPVKCGEYFYYYRTEEGKNYKIHCRKHKSLDTQEEIILDGNELAKDQKYMSLGAMKISSDQKLLAYSVDFTGGEVYETRILNLESGEVVDSISKVGVQIEWANDDKAIYYSEQDDIHREYAISRHIIGTAQSDDIQILEEPDTTFMVFMTKSKDSQYLLFRVGGYSSETMEIRYLDLQKGSSEIEMFFPKTKGVEFYIDHHSDYFYFMTNIDNPMTFRLMRTKDSTTGQDNWEQVIDKDFEVRIPFLVLFQNHIVINSREGGYADYVIYDTNSGNHHSIALPESIYGLSTSIGGWLDIFYYTNPEFETDTFRFIFHSPVTPKSVYEYKMNSKELTLMKTDEIVGYNPSDYANERRYATTVDGTKIPISLAFKKGTQFNVDTPVFLTAYGSYGAPSEPIFDFKRLSLLERGLVCAIAHVRGGGEFGKKWYHQGKLENKMNSFTDFIACAEHLIQENITSRQKLSVWGGSAGGLLVGAVVNMRPDLFGCVVATVPFVDVISTMLDESIPLTTFEYNEWGNPNIKEQFDWMIEYSPYDHVEAKEYPTMLITAGYNDPRVQYWEPAKWTAKMRDMRTDYNLLLLKTKMESGHFSASGRYDYMKDWAFIYTFILDTLESINQ